METGRENSIPVVKDYQRDGSWVPVTPVKSRSTTLQKICSDRLTNQTWVPVTPVKSRSTTLQKICSDRLTNQTAQKKLSESEKTSQGNQLSETNCLESEVLRPCLEISSQDHKVDACCSSKDFININGKINNLDAILPTKSEAQRNSVGFYNNLSNDDEERWQYVSFAQLLALADASTVTLAHAPLQNQVNAARSSFVSFSNPQVAESPLVSTIENPSPTSQDPLLGTKFQPNSSCTSDICHYGHSTSSQLSVELNSPLGAAEVFLSSISPQFAPITPDQAKKTEKGQSSDFQELIVNGGVDHSRGSQNGISTEMVTGNELHQETEQLEQLTDHAVAELPNQLLEIHNPDKGGRQGTETNKTPQQKTRRKRHRPKVVIEGQPKQTRKPRTPKPAPNPQTGKRKYVRKNGINKSATPTPEITGEITGSKPAQKVRKSCRRPLNFDFEYEAKEESSSSRPSSNFDYESHEHNYLTRTLSRSTAQVRKGTEETTVKEQVYIDNDISYSENQVLEGSIPKPDRQTPGPTTPSKAIPANKIMIADFHNGFARGKCRITFSEETHDKDISTAQLIKNNVQSLPRSPNDSNYSSNEFLTIAKQTREIKRKHPSMIDEANLFTVNVIESRYPSEHAHTIISPFGEYYSRLPYVQFPTVYKKRRTERGHTSVRCETLSTMTEAENHARQMWPFIDASTVSFTSEISCSIPAAHVNAIPRTEAMQDVQHPLKCVLAFSDKERLTKRRSKGATRLHSLATLNEISKQLPSEIHKFMQGYQNPHQSNTCIEAQARVRMAKGKRTKRKSNINSVPSNCNHQKFLNESIAPPAISQINMSFNAVADQFEHLNINAQSSQAPYEESNELVPYNQSFNGGTSLALYQMNGTLVPFEGSFDQVRKQRPRPKVELDDETNRVWKLLLEDINSKGIDGTDQEKAKWWEEERRVFRGRADSFIARMHLIQGDRRFSQWKGSVVDSVVGVFLTQNVSDHLSSSAFMSLAAHFPLKPKSANGQPHEERASISVCILDADDTVEWHEEQPNQPPFDQSFLKLQNMKYREEMEVSNQNIYVEDGCNDVKAPDNSRCELLDSSKSSPEMYSQSAANTSGTHTTEVDTITIEDQSEMEDALSSQNSVVSYQNSMNLSCAQTDEKICSCSQNNLEAEQPAWSTTSDGFGGSTSFVELLHRAGSIMYNGVYDHMNVNMLSTKSGYCQSKGMPFVLPKQDKNQLDNVSASSKLNMPSSSYQPNMTLDSGVHELGCLEMLKEENCTSEQSALSVESVSQARVKEMKTLSSQERPKTPNGNNLRNNYQVEVNKVSTSLNIVEHSKNDIELQSQGCVHEVQQVFKTLVNSETLDVGRTTSVLHNTRETKHMLVGQSLNDLFGMNTGTSKPRRGQKGKEKQSTIDWDILRKQAQANGRKREKTENTMDSLDWEAVRQADVNEIAKTIKERGMNNVLAERIKDFLNRLVRDHGSVDIEWLRDVPPDKAKEYLLSIRGLGLKSVECVRLLTLQHLAFPVDTNVGRIAVRLGWVPLQPLPESLQLHLLELYPVLESIQKYLWPRLCKLDQRTLYELHYQMITFGKVFCTKSKPNCNACPMRGECRHFASAFASARLALPAPEDKSIVSRTETKVVDQSPVGIIHPLQLPLPQSNKQQELLVRNSDPIVEVPTTPEPIVEVPGTPEPEHTLILESDIEDAICEDPDEIPTIKLNMVEFTQNLQNYMQKNMEIQEGDTSKALVSLTPEAASIPTPKLKNVSQLRTEHRVYEIPDSHPLLEGLDRREPDDPSPYLLAIWTPGETTDSIQPPEIRCNFQDFGELCVEKTCFSCNSIREAKYQTVRGTLLIPCRTAMRGSFPLNGTYFQVNEVFADHESSLNPIHVPRDWLWNLPRRTVYFGTSIPTIFKGLSTDGIQYCFWRGFVCVRGFDQKTRAPRPLIARLHFPASKLTKARGSTYKN